MPVNKFKSRFQNLRISYRRFWRLVWPIRWRLFLKPLDVWKSLSFSSYPLKFGLVVSLIVGIISMFLTYGSLYAMSVYKLPAKSGYIEEGLLGLNRNDISNFNPLLTPNSDYERRITSLVFHPLYRVALPDFNGAKTEIKITPVLLGLTPKWIDNDNPDPNNRFKRLRMVLKDDLKWSDGKTITIDDVMSTFQKLQDKEANQEFSPNLQGVTFEVINGQRNTFDLVSSKPSPQLLYAANFSPVPKDIFFNQSITQIAQSASKFPQITSGFYAFSTSQSGVVTDPRFPNNDKRPNPFIDNRTGVIQSIILEKNKYQNETGADPYIQYYIFQRYPKFKNDLGTDPQTITSSYGVDSLQDSFLGNKSSLYFRSTINSIDASLSSNQVKQTLNTAQKVIPANTFYSLFLKAQNGTYLVNKNLRKYILCSLKEAKIYSNLDAVTQSSLIEIDKSKMLLPPQLQISKNVDCGANLTDIVTNTEKKSYTIKNAEAGNGSRKIFLGNKQISLILVASDKDRIVGQKVQEILRNAGFVVDILDQDQLSQQPANSAVIYLYPITTASPDIYNLFSKKSQNLVAAGANNDLVALEDELLNYRNSAYSDAGKSKLADFLSDAMVTMTIAQGKEEYNYSSKVFGLPENLPEFSTMTYDIYNKLPSWYIDRETKSKIFG